MPESAAVQDSEQFTITPEVDQVREFIEIAHDFSNPLELVREAISNSYDAGAHTIRISFDVPEIAGERRLRVSIEDDGEGMDRLGLKSFFDLGNSLRRDQRAGNPSLIGEKGHGTKVYLNSAQIQVVTCRDGGAREYCATVERPLAALHEGRVPEVRCCERAPQSDWHGTRIEVLGYNNDRRSMFTHAELRDYILWFTRVGSLQQELTDTADPTRLLLKGLDASDFEEIAAGHRFPEESASTTSLFEQYTAKAPDYYARRFARSGALPDFPEIKYQASFWVEGDYIKRQYNSMIRGRGRSRQAGDYQVQERYGLWLCKDFIPVERREGWTTTKGSEYTKFHAFVNCQALSLTANRGSVANTPSEVLTGIERVCREFYTEIVSSQEWMDMEWLEEEASAYVSQEKERQSLESRAQRIGDTPKTTYRGKDILLPRQEAGVYSAYLTFDVMEPGLFPFEVLDYDKHQGIDVIARPRLDGGPTEVKMRFVEFKYRLDSGFNHSFEHLHAIVCWELGCQVDEELPDAASESRVLKCTPAADGQHTTYFLEHPRKARRVEVIVLPVYLREKLGVQFV